MKLYTPLAFALGFFLTLTVTAQKQTTTNANKDIDLVKVYEQVIEEGFGNRAIYLKLANEHYFQGNYKKAKMWFEMVFDTKRPADKKLIFRYKQTLKALQLDVKNNPYIAVLGTY